METSKNNMSNYNKSTSKIHSEKASQAEKKEPKFKYKKSEEANKLSIDTGPWWRFAGGEELVYLASQRSVNLIENCDLPHPKSNFGNCPPSLYLNARGANIYKQAHWNSSSPEEHNTQSDPTKAHLLEELCHCQTRAREAERLTNQAYAEKEQILKLFFREATHLFAYKQWFQLLQLENLLLQNKISNTSNNGDVNDQPKTRKLHRNKKYDAQRKHISKQNMYWYNYISKLGVAFALGFSLIGSGMLLGWTVGLISPLF